MQHTSNYNLPQWEATDPIKRADFNGAMSAIDTAIKAASDAAGGAPKMEIGTYTGTGTYGSANKNTLTFSFPPKLVVIRCDDNFGYGVTFIRPAALCVLDNCGAYYSYKLYITWSGNSVSWYNSNRNDYQLNVSGSTYYYVAFG